MPARSLDGVRLFFQQAGQGDPPLLLVHGWCCDHTYMAPQYQHFRRRRRVVAVDLRGHGRSGKPEREYSIEGFARDLHRLLAEIGVERPVVAGHSMGGLIGLEMAAQRPEAVAGVVLLDSPLLYPESVVERNRRFLASLETPGFREAQRQYVSRALFLPGDDRERRARIVDEMSRAPQHVMVSAFRSLLEWDNLDAVARSEVPVLLISAAYLLTDMARLRQHLPKAMTAQTAGAGHFHHLEVPDQVNAMIERFLRNLGT